MSFSRYLPYIRDYIGLSNTQTELIMTIRSVSSMVTILFVGRVYKRISLRRGMFFSAMGMVGTNSWCGDLSSPEQYPETVRKTQLAFNIGSVIFSVVPGIIADITGNYSASYIIFGAQLLIAGVLVEALYIRRARASQQ